MTRPILSNPFAYLGRDSPVEGLKRGTEEHFHLRRDFDPLFVVHGLYGRNGGVSGP